MIRNDDEGELISMQGTIDRQTRGQLRAFQRYWQSMRKGHDVPRRTDIDPRGIEAVLEHALIAEKIAPGLARLRIAGTHLTDLVGMEVRGMPLSTFIAPDHRPLLQDALTELFERPAMVELDLQAPGRMGAPEMTGRLLLLPLRSDLGDISRALGCFVTQGAIGRTPRRFRILNRKFTPVAPASEAARSPGFAEPEPAFERAGTQNPFERPYLRVVK